MVVVRLLGVASSVPFAQFSYALYGVASGGNSWSYVFQAHPEVLSLPEPAKTRMVYQLAFMLIQDQPALLVQGALHNWAMFFSNSWYNVFSFVSGENSRINTLVRWILYVLSLSGIAKWIRNTSDPYTSFTIAAALGVLLSVPFVPPADSYGMRLYAASLMLIGLLPAMGLAFLLESLKITTLYEPALPSIDGSLTTGLSALLILLVTIGPLLVKGSNTLSSEKLAACEGSMDSVLIRFHTGSYVSVIREKDSGLDWLPVFHQGIFKQNAHGLTDPALIGWLEDVAPSTTLFSTLDYRSNQSTLVVLPTALLPKQETAMLLCGRWEMDPLLQKYNIFIAKGATVVSS
jgi:hypothetical protein